MKNLDQFESMNNLRVVIRSQNNHWWTDENGAKLPFNIGEKLMLIVSEVAEAMAQASIDA